MLIFLVCVAEKHQMISRWFVRKSLAIGFFLCELISIPVIQKNIQGSLDKRTFVLYNISRDGLIVTDN